MVEEFGCIIYEFKPSFSSFLKVFKGLWFPIFFTAFCICVIIFVEGLFSPNLLMEMILVVGGFLVPYLYFPRSFVLTSRGIVIQRIFNSVFIPYSKVRYVKKTSLEDVAREFKIEGWFLTHIALWMVKQILTHVIVQDSRHIYFYATDIEKTIIIESCSGEKYYISPQNPEQFERTIKIFTKIT